MNLSILNFTPWPSGQRRWLRIFVWGSYPASLRNVGGSTLPIFCAANIWRPGISCTSMTSLSNGTNSHLGRVEPRRFISRTSYLETFLWGECLWLDPGTSRSADERAITGPTCPINFTLLMIHKHFLKTIILSMKINK